MLNNSNITELDIKEEISKNPNIIYLSIRELDEGLNTKRWNRKV